MKKPIIFLAALAVTALPTFAQAPTAILPDDNHTLFLDRFENSLDADSAAGSPRASGQVGLTNEGRFGSGVVLKRGLATSPDGLILPFLPLRFETTGNFDTRRGTLEFWMRPALQPLEERNFGTNYYLLDSWEGTGFRFVLQDNLKGERQLLWFEKAAPADEQWQLAAKLPEWKANEWHHLAIVWDGKYRALYADGVLLAEKDSPFAALPFNKELTVGASIHNTWPAQAIYDDLRISDIARYGTRGSAPLPAGSTLDTPPSLRVQWKNETATPAKVEANPSSRPLRGGLTLHEIKLHNTGTAPQNVRVWLETPLKLQRGWTFWDGRAARRSHANRVLAQDEMMNTFSMICAYDGKSGVALGLEANELRSWFGSRAWSSGNAGGARFETKAVLAPGETDTVRFVSFEFAPEYDYRSAVQIYQDAFPERFRPAENLDPRVLTGSLAASAFYAKPDQPPGAPMFSVPEIARRSGARWEWMYAPFRYSGDLVVRPEWWNLITIPPKKATAEAYEPTADAFLKARKAQFEAVEKWDIAPMFYYINWIHEVLGDRYKDALIAPEDAYDQRGVKIGPWVKSYSTDLRAFWWGTEFETATKADMQALIKTLPISGFAHDVAVGGARYRGPGMWKTPGRAYDERGAYVEEGIGIALMMDYVHSLRGSTPQVGEYRLGNTANPTPASTYSIPLRLDNSIYEGRVDEALGKAADMERVRLLHGQKPRSLYLRTNGWRFGSRLDVAAISPQELRDFYHRLWDYTLLWALHEGYSLPPDFVFGYERTARMAKILMETAAKGWQPVTAMHSDAPLWLARYGRGDGSTLVLLNPREEAVSATVRVDQKYLTDEKSSLLFAPWDGTAQPQSYRQGGSTLSVNLPPRGALILQAVAAIPRAANYEGKVSQNWQAASGKIEVSPAAPNARFIGREYFASAGNGRFRSTLFVSDQNALLQFPWQAATIVADNSEAQKWAAWRTGEYFRFVKAASGDKKAELLPVAASAPTDKPSIILQRGDAMKIQRQGDQIILTSPDSDWSTLLGELFAQLDVKFTFVGEWSLYLPHVRADAISDAPTKEALLKMGYPGAAFMEK
jgi:hypothetical protein